ncbi:MAG: hypothetical protein LLG20_14010 [Acidobacteriales bacterium]|nr:hypothetical protein [Terriglobales bacterium]
MTRLPWYAVRVRSNYEFTTATILHGKGYEEFVPAYEVERRWSDRKQTLRLPLLPGYVLCRLDLQFRLPVLQSPGVVHIVSFGKVPAAVDEGEVAALERIVRAQVAAEPWPYLEIGDPVRIVRGPLVGLKGALLEFKKTCRLVVSVTLLQRSVAAEIDSTWIMPTRMTRHLDSAAEVREA